MSRFILIACIISIFSSSVQAASYKFDISNDDINKIVKLCSGGSGNIKAEADLKAGIGFWKKAVGLQGGVSYDSAGTIFTKVKKENNLSEIYPTHIDCVTRLLKDSMIEGTQEKISAAVADKSNPTKVEIVFSDPKCDTNQNNNFGECTVAATAKGGDAKLCLNGERSRLLSGGKDLSNIGAYQKRLSIAGAWYEQIDDLELIEDVPVRVGMFTEAQNLDNVERIDMLELMTCQNKPIRYKSFSKSGIDDNITFVLK